MRKLNTRGFTIVELLIATAVFSIVLLIITFAIIQFSRVYYKGVITTKIQETARSVAEDIARSAQFNPGAMTSDTTGGTFKTYCFGDKRYNFNTDTNAILGSTARRILLADTEASCTAYNGNVTTLPAHANDATELLGENMRLLDLTITDGDIITVKVTIGYGSDVVNSGGNWQCPAISLGGQFCAVSSIETKVTKRL